MRVKTASDDERKNDNTAGNTCLFARRTKPTHPDPAQNKKPGWALSDSQTTCMFALAAHDSRTTLENVGEPSLDVSTFYMTIDDKIIFYRM